jgi:hypothetical protein
MMRAIGRTEWRQLPAPGASLIVRNGGRENLNGRAFCGASNLSMHKRMATGSPSMAEDMHRRVRRSASPFIRVSASRLALFRLFGRLYAYL